MNPELVCAVVTRSRDSFTAASGKPTMMIMVSPQSQLRSPVVSRRETMAGRGTKHAPKNHFQERKPVRYSPASSELASCSILCSIGRVILRKV